MIPVDHSIPGACGTIIYASDTTIAYSGDLRLHGTDGHLTELFIQKVNEAKPDIFLCEGTRIDSNEKHGEEIVRMNSKNAVSNTRGLVLADYAWKDTTRFKTFLEIARENNRKLCISFREAYYIRELKKYIKDLPDLNDSDILLYKRKMRSGTYRESDYDKEVRDFLNSENTVDADYVHSNENEIIMELAYWHIQELIDVKPLPGSLYIKSASEAFTEEQLFDMERLRKWLEFFHLKYENFHASGHAPAQDLKRVMEGSAAKMIMPIHTEHPEMFGPLIKNAIKIEFPNPSY
jgi:ribonuclease J